MGTAPLVQIIALGSLQNSDQTHRMRFNGASAYGSVEPSFFFHGDDVDLLRVERHGANPPFSGAFGPLRTQAAIENHHEGIADRLGDLIAVHVLWRQDLRGAGDHEAHHRDRGRDFALPDLAGDDFPENERERGEEFNSRAPDHPAGDSGHHRPRRDHHRHALFA